MSSHWLPRIGDVMVRRHTVTVTVRRRKLRTGIAEVVESLRKYKGGGAALAARLVSSNNGWQRVRMSFFSYFGFDHEQPSHHEALNILLASAALVLRRSNGRPRFTTFWDNLRLLQLKFHYEEVIRNHPGMSASKAAAAIWSAYPAEYQAKGITVETIRQRLSKSRTL
jgi:hypothetical protein